MSGLFAAALFAAPLPVTGGDVWNGDPAVVAIGPSQPGSDEVARCTGVLVAAGVVLTAAHCVAAGDALAVTLGAETVSPEDVLLVAAVELNQAYDPQAGAGDLALLFLAEDPAAPPLALGPAPAAGERVRLVGFGVDGEGSPFGRKRSGFARVEGVSADSLRLAPDPSLSCGGDSGGPVLASDGTREWVAAIIRSGDAACQDHSTATRVDFYLPSFVAPAIPSEAMSGGCQAAGAPGPITAALVLLLFRRRRRKSRAARSSPRGSAR